MFSDTRGVSTLEQGSELGKLLQQLLPPQKQQGGGGLCALLSFLFSLFLSDLFSSWKLSRGWKEWRLGWPKGLGREAGENTFQILIKSLFVVCSLKPLRLSPLSLRLGFPLSLSLPVSHSLPMSLLLLSQSPHLPSGISVSPRLSLSVCLSPGPSIFQTPPLSASTSVCPSLPVLVHLSVSLRLPVRGCLCPSVPPPICLVVCVSPSKGAHSLPKVPSPRSAKASPGSGVGRGCRAAASGSFSSSWAELGVRG